LSPVEHVVVGAGITGQFSRDFQAPFLISILVGEAVYNLRAALDYLVFELAILDSGHVATRSQFPILRTQKDWNRYAASLLSGVNGDHRAAIKDLQPFNGVEWTAQLRDLSNPDKHQRLVMATHGTKVTVHANASVKTHALGSALKRPVGTKSEVSHILLFDDGLPVAGTLWKIRTGVNGAVEAFDPDFQR